MNAIDAIAARLGRLKYSTDRGQAEIEAAGSPDYAPRSASPQFDTNPLLARAVLVRAGAPTPRRRAF